MLGNVVNVKFNMNFLDVTSAGSLDRSQDHVASVDTTRRKKTLTKDIVEIVSRFMNYLTAYNASTIGSNLEDVPTVEQLDQTTMNGSTLVLDRMLNIKNLSALS